MGLITWWRQRNTCRHTEFNPSTWSHYRRCGKTRGHTFRHGEFTELTERQAARIRRANAAKVLGR
jgi:hypothetical protein